MPRDVASLIDGARAGHARDVARLISLVEDGGPDVPAMMQALAGTSGHARVIGITGSPGVGKSTTTAALIDGLRQRGERVAVLAVDPSSPFSGGALLGDRIRMQDQATDPGVFIRSMAARGHLGGLAATTAQAMRILDAAGFDTVLMETVGVGQSEIEVAQAADTTLVLVAPGMGDAIQAAKAGILEVGDVLVVNKADREDADRTVRELENMIAMAGRSSTAWTPPIVRTVATTGSGLDELLAVIDAHGEWLVASGAGHLRRVRRARAEIEVLALAQLRERLDRAGDGTALERSAEEVSEGRLDAFTAATRVVDSL